MRRWTRRFSAFVSDTELGVTCGYDRDEADEWLRQYPDDAPVMPSIGRDGWNTLRTDDSIPREELLEAIDDSDEMVVSRLPASRRPEGWD